MSQALEGLLGNDQTRRSLQNALQKGTLSHAVLLAAPDGCGRNFAARCLAADYLYPNGGPAADAVLRGESTEVLLIEGEGASGQIKIDRVRKVRSDLFHTGLSASGRVVLVRDADNMAAPSANALLKVLEEPPAGVLFILTARDAASLPATIRSRCALFPLAPVSAAECEKALLAQMPAGENPEKAHFLSTLYGGRIGLGLKALQDEDRFQLLQAALDAANAAAQKDGYALLRLFSAYEGRGEEERLLREQFLSDMTEVLACALRCQLPSSAGQIPPERAAALIPPVQNAGGALRRNASAKLTFAALAVHLTKETL